MNLGWLLEPRNHGYAAAADLALRDARADAICVANADVRPDRDMLADRAPSRDSTGVEQPTPDATNGTLVHFEWTEVPFVAVERGVRARGRTRTRPPPAGP